MLEECRSGTFMLRVVISDDIAALKREYALAPGSREISEGLRGFAALDIEGNPVVFVPVLRDQHDTDRLRTWGHELAHVACGQWHDRIE